jgi:tRNA-uridine 2-sulfurtransferase
MRVGVAISGGMDSAAAALIMKGHGYEVIGFHTILEGHSPKNREAADQAARELRIPLNTIDLSREFREIVIKGFLKEYTLGRTPSPCPICNRSIKMSLLRREALAMGCDKFCTGHYAVIGSGASGASLRMAADRSKDQSYFLFALSKEMLQSLICPLGRMTKQAVRELLREAGISVWQEDESQELCFIPEGNYRDFLASNGISSEPGPIVNVHGVQIGVHKGIANYTVGQRSGLGVCGPEPYYVIRLDASNGSVTVGTRREAMASSLRVENINLLRPELIMPSENLTVKVRSTSKPAECKVKMISEDTLDIELVEPQNGVAPGQAAVIYFEDEVVGGGWIA